MEGSVRVGIGRKRESEVVKEREFVDEMRMRISLNSRILSSRGDCVEHVSSYLNIYLSLLGRDCLAISEFRTLPFRAPSFLSSTLLLTLVHIP